MSDEYDKFEEQLKLIIKIGELLQVQGGYMREFEMQLKSYDEYVKVTDLIFDKINQAIKEYKEMEVKKQ